MSRWAEGNFDEDLAPEILLALMHQLFKVVQDCLDTDNELSNGESELMPAIDILVTLGRAYTNMVRSTLQEQPIAEWKAQYLRLFDEQSEMPLDNPFHVERRKVIADTFTNLERLL